MGDRAFLVSKAERDLRSSLERMPKVEVAVVRPKKKKKGPHSNDAKVALVSGSAGTVLTLGAKKVGGAAAGRAAGEVTGRIRPVVTRGARRLRDKRVGNVLWREMRTP